MECDIFSQGKVLQQKNASKHQHEIPKSCHDLYTLPQKAIMTLNQKQPEVKVHQEIKVFFNFETI